MRLHICTRLFVYAAYRCDEYKNLVGGPIFFCDICNNVKVSNGAKIRNRYNQVPHLTQSQPCISVTQTCVDPDRFCQTASKSDKVVFIFFIFSEERGSKISLKADHYRPTSETAFKWRFADMSMMAQHCMLAW